MIEDQIELQGKTKQEEECNLFKWWNKEDRKAFDDKLPCTWTHVSLNISLSYKVKVV